MTINLLLILPLLGSLLIAILPSYNKTIIIKLHSWQDITLYLIYTINIAILSFTFGYHMYNNQYSNDWDPSIINTYFEYIYYIFLLIINIHFATSLYLIWVICHDLFLKKDKIHIWNWIWFFFINSFLGLVTLWLLLLRPDLYRIIYSFLLFFYLGLSMYNQILDLIKFEYESYKNKNKFYTIIKKSCTIFKTVFTTNSLLFLFLFISNYFTLNIWIWLITPLFFCWFLYKIFRSIFKYLHEKFNGCKFIINKYFFRWYNSLKWPTSVFSAIIGNANFSRNVDNNATLLGNNAAGRDVHDTSKVNCVDNDFKLIVSDNNTNESYEEQISGIDLHDKFVNHSPAYKNMLRDHNTQIVQSLRDGTFEVGSNSSGELVPVFDVACKVSKDSTEYAPVGITENDINRDTNPPSILIHKDDDFETMHASSSFDDRYQRHLNILNRNNDHGDIDMEELQAQKACNSRTFTDVNPDPNIQSNSPLVGPWDNDSWVNGPGPM